MPRTPVTEIPAAPPTPTRSRALPAPQNFARRDPELTPELIARIASNIRGGASPSDASRIERVSDATMGRWLRSRGPLFDELRQALDHASAVLRTRLQTEVLAQATSQVNPDGTIVRHAKGGLAISLLRTLRSDRQLGFGGGKHRVTGLPPARKTAWSMRRQKKVAILIARGQYFKSACAAAGVAVDTANLWMRDGRAEAAKEYPDESLYYLQFYRAISHARDIAEHRSVDVVSSHIENGSLKAATWWLTHGPAKSRWSSVIAMTQKEAPQESGDIVETLEQKIGAHVAAMPVETIEEEAQRIEGVLELLDDGSGVYKVQS